MRRLALSFGVAATIVCLVAGTSWAQDVSSSTATKNFEVITVNGNTLVVHLPEGDRELTVPDTFRFTVDGQPVSVHELMPGMKGTAVITTTTTTTPVTVTEVKEGEVVLTGGGSVSVRTGDQIKQFSQADLEKRGIKLMRNGQPAQLSEFRRGDRLSATIVTSQPPRVVTEREVQATLARPPATTRAPAAEAPAGGASTTGTTGTAGAAGAGTQTSTTGTRSLPHTAGRAPALVLAGLTAIAAAALLAARRRRRSV